MCAVYGTMHVHVQEEILRTICPMKGVSEGEVFSDIIYLSSTHMNTWVRLSPPHHIGVLRRLILTVGQSGLRKSSSRQNIQLIILQNLALKLFLRIVSQCNTVVCIISTHPSCEDIVRVVLYYVDVLVVVNSLHWCEFIKENRWRIWGGGAKGARAPLQSRRFFCAFFCACYRHVD